MQDGSLAEQTQHAYYRPKKTTRCVSKVRDSTCAFKIKPIISSCIGALALQLASPLSGVL